MGRETATVSPELMFRLRERLLDQHKAMRSEINRKAAWCAVFPPFGWFGRADRIEAEHERLNGSIRDLIRQQAASTPPTESPEGEEP